MLVNLAATVTSFTISFLIIPVIIKYSIRKNLVDIPGRRKIHKKETPSMGGIAIFLGFLISIMIWLKVDSWPHIRYIIAALLIVFFIGMRDDLVPIRPVVKLLGQVIAAFVLVVLGGVRLSAFYGLFAIIDVPYWLTIVVSIFTIIVVTNAFNLIDGLDGLAGTISSISLLVFGIWFYLVDDIIFAMLAFAMLGGILAFLKYNWEPSEIFMGDTGALVVGLFLSILVIHFIDESYTIRGDSPQLAYRFKSSIAAGVCVIIIPMLDTLRIVILRLTKRQSPFRPDKSHIHHAIMRLGATHRRTTIILGSFQIIYILLAVFVFKNIGENYSDLTILVLSIAFSVTLDRMIINRLSQKE